MKLVGSIFFLFLGFPFARSEDQVKSKSSKAFGHSSSHMVPKFISFDSEDGQIDINWDVTIPLVSIPLKHVGEDGEPSPLFNVNKKALGIAGLVTGILTLIAPLFSKPHPGPTYRSMDDGWQEMGSIVNEVILGNNYVGPCLQRIVCSVVRESSRAENPTSTKKIIDGLSSHKWFRDATNGTIIQDAIKIGRDGNRDCAEIFKNCQASPKLLKSIMAQLGLI